MDLSELSRDSIIERYYPQVQIWVKAFVARHPDQSRRYDDFVSEASIRLVKVVDAYLAQKVKHFEVYLRLSVCTAIADVIGYDTTIKTPRKKGIPCDTLYSEPVDPSTERPTRSELLDATCCDVEDRVILTMAVQGYTRKEIAKYLCQPQSFVRNRVAGILRRASGG